MLYIVQKRIKINPAHHNKVKQNQTIRIHLSEYSNYITFIPTTIPLHLLAKHMTGQDA